MGNQLAATPTVDLANVSNDLELIAPLGADGRNYFATFHCLYYTLLNSSPSSVDANTSAGGVNAPSYTTDFLAADAAGRRSEYRTSSLYYPSSSQTVTTTSTANTAASPVGSPLMAYQPSASGGRGRGRGGGLAYGSAMYASSLPSNADPLHPFANCTTRIAARDRAAWHQARWRQRLPVAARPWRVHPSMFVSEGISGVLPSADALDRWCRDSNSTNPFLSGSSGSGGFTFTSAVPPLSGSRVDGFASDYIASSSPSLLSPSPSFISATSPTFRGGSTTATTAPSAFSRTDIDATVAGVVGEWRGNYGNYVQLLLRGGGVGSASAALCDGQVIQVAPPSRSSGVNGGGGGAAGGYGARGAFTAAMTMTMPSTLSASAAAGANAGTQSYVMHDVVTKVFVRSPDNQGQTYFLKHVRQMMDNAGEQLSVIDSTLPATAPRNCLWYTLLYEGDGFCVLQRPYVAFTLRERLAARPAWTEQDKLFATYQLLQAVAHLHETYGLTHGDIKPNNVLVQSTGVVVLCDMAPFKPWRLPLDSPLLFDYYYDTEESRACYVAPEKFSDQPLPTPPPESKTPGNATYNVSNLNFEGHTAAMDVFSTACVLLFLYKEEDPFTLSDVLNLHHLTTVDARESAMAPVLQQCGVPARLRPLLLSMLCSSNTERPSARELLSRGLDDGVFPACFPFLYETVLPRLLVLEADARLRLLHNQLDAVLQQCVELDGGSAVVSRATAVRVLLPLLLQTIHSRKTSDEATFRGLLCLKRCVVHCPFDALADFVLPHLVSLVNNDAHVYGAAARLVAIRLLCSVSETIARQLTAQATSISDQVSSKSVYDEEQWALMEHLVLPCLYDVLRQGEQESTAVLVELAERLPRLLLLTRFMTERRQVLYGAEEKQQVSISEPLETPIKAAQQQPQVTPPQPQQQQVSASVEVIPTDGAETHTASATSNATEEAEKHDALTPENAIREDSSVVADTLLYAATASHAAHATAAAIGAGGDNTAETLVDVPGNSTAGTTQYLAQLRCLLSNGWNMLQLLYNHPSVAVAAAMMRQSTSTVAAFLGEERVAEELIPLLTTALTSPLRVLRLLFPQAILLHALLQRPPAKTLRLFVEEGLRHADDVCLKGTLDSMAVVVRSKKLPLEDLMGLVHQSLPFLMDHRLWLREAACGVVEAAAQVYPPSDVAVHLEYAVRPLLTHPVPLSQLRRFAASIIRAEMASATPSARYHATSVPVYEGRCHDDDGGGGGEESGEWSLSDYRYIEFYEPGKPGSTAAARPRSHHVDFRDALPSVVSAAAHTSAATAPTLLHTLPTSPPAPPTSVPHRNNGVENGVTEAAGLTYTPLPRESSRVALEAAKEGEEGDALHSLPASATAAVAPTLATVAASRAMHVNARASHRQQQSASAPHVVALSPLPRTLAPHSTLCRSGVLTLASKDDTHRSASFVPSSTPPPPSVGSTATLSAAQVSRSSVSALDVVEVATAASAFSPLCPIAAPLCTATTHMGAIYTTAASPTASGVVLTAGARGEAMIWRVGASLGHAAHTRELSLMERVPVPRVSGVASAPLVSSTNFAYVASQWMDGALQRRDASSGAAAAATSPTVALASTDGAVHLLDVGRNAWMWCATVGHGSEGAVTALALHDRTSLLVTTAAGGLHVVDTRCRGGTSTNAPSAFRSAWSAHLDPLDGAPSCVVPLYSGDRAAAAVVGTYGGVVCLYDLRFQLCAQRTALFPHTGGATRAFSSSSPRPFAASITSVCADPLSSLCRGCRPSPWEPAVAGPSVLVSTSTGTVYRLLLQPHGVDACWPVLQCRGDSGAVRCVLAQPTCGTVLTGSEDGYIRHWSLDQPEASHTMSCIPYSSPEYTVGKMSVATPAEFGSSSSGTAGVLRGVKRTAQVLVREREVESGLVRRPPALPRHAPDAILSLCAARTPATSWGSTAADGHTFLLSGARDGSLTLWDNEE